MSQDPLHVLEAILFESPTPVPEEELRRLLPPGADLDALAAQIEQDYASRGLVLSRTKGGLAIRTAPAASDLAGLVADPAPRLSRAALETAACIAAFEEAGSPLTRGEIERVRGVGLSPGILDALLLLGYVRSGPRRETRGRPLTWLATPRFYDALGLRSLSDIPAFVEMLEAGLVQIRLSDTLPDESEMGGEDAAA